MSLHLALEKLERVKVVNIVKLVKYFVSRFKMKAIAKTITSPHKYIYKHFYSTSGSKKAGKLNLELSDILTDDEIEHEVNCPKDSEFYFVRAKSMNDAIFSRSKKCGLGCRGTVERWRANGGDPRHKDRLCGKSSYLKTLIPKLMFTFILACTDGKTTLELLTVSFRCYQKTKVFSPLIYPDTV